MGNPIDCIRLHAKDLFKDAKEDISRQDATDLALKEFEKLHGELENFKKSLDKKYTVKPFVSPDKSQRIKEIEDEYAKNIEEINKEDERIKAEQKLKSEKPTTETGEGAGKEPPKLPGKEEKGEGEGEKKGGITHEGTEETTQKAGLPDYERGEPVTHEQRIAAAKKAIAENPNLADETLSKVEKGGNLTPQDNAVLAVYKGALDAELDKNPSKEVYDRVSRIAKVLNPEGTYAGQLLESRKLIDFNEDNLANFLMGKEAAQGTSLSEKQVKDEAAKFTELKKAKDALAELEAADKEAYNKLVAEIGVNKAKAAARKASKKTKEEHISDRKAIVDKAREALKKIRTDGSLKSTIPGLAELKALTPHIKDYMQDLLNEGVDKFDNIVSAIHAEFKDVLDNLRKADVIDILAGNYDEVKEQTRNEKANSLRLVQREAKLIKELADARKGIETAKTQNQVTEKNRRIDELKDKIKEVRKINKEKNAEVDPVEDAAAKLAQHRERLRERAIINELAGERSFRAHLERLALATVPVLPPPPRASWASHGQGVSFDPVAVKSPQ